MYIIYHKGTDRPACPEGQLFVFSSKSTAESFLRCFAEVDTTFRYDSEGGYEIKEIDVIVDGNLLNISENALNQK